MDEFTQAQEAPKDRWGRYLVDKGGKKLGYTRVTTIAKTLSDTASLADWKTRMAITGLIQRQDLLAQASTALDDRNRLNQIASEAIEAAGAYSRANLGTALHALTQELDLGRLPMILPGLQADIDAYQQAIQAHRLTMPPEFIEVLVINDTVEYAGTADRFTILPDGRLVVFDLKTGSSLDYGKQEMAIQLAAYANAEHIYNWRTGERTPMPKLVRETGIICHLPAGEGRCTLHQVDLVEGWKAFQLAIRVRGWRKAKDLFTALPAEQPTQDNQLLRDIIRERIAALPKPKQAELKQLWPAGAPKLANCTVPQLNQIGDLIDTISPQEEW
jgi:hypothetical protein